MKPRTARSLSSVAAWVFGLATSVLLVSFWGRAVVVDSDELSANLRPMSQSEQVTSIFVDWMSDQLVESGVPQDQADAATQNAVSAPVVEAALSNVVEEVVMAAATPGTEAVTVDIASLMSPTVPAVTEAVVAAGVPVTADQVAGVVSGLDPLVIREQGEPPQVGESSPLARRLGLATVVALAVQLIFGSLYVILSSSRLGAARTLFTRFAVGALSFGVLLRLGSWVLDPEGGRAPVSESLSLVAESKWMVPAILGTLAAIVAVLIWLAKLGVAQPPSPGVTPVAATPTRGGSATRL